MSTNYPDSLDDSASLPNPTATSKTNNPSHTGIHSTGNDAIKALEAKVGTGDTIPAANQFLFGKGAGTSAWGAITSAELAAAVSDETGSGKLVFGTSPTLVTPAVDTIDESTTDNGVTIDGLNIKDGVLNTSSSVPTSALADGAVTPAKWANPYKFSAYATVATSITSSFVKIAFSTEEFDTGSNFSTANSRFTAPVGGVYLFIGRFTCTSSSNAIQASIYVNGSEAKKGQYGATFSAQVQAIIKLTAGDYVELYGYSASTQNNDVGSSPISKNYFQGFLVSET